MARRKNTGMSVNLFPFLSILVCIIGCLTLIIVVVNLSQMEKAEGRTPDEILRAQEWLELKKQQEEDREEYDKLRNLIESLIQENRDLIAKRDKLVRLKELQENQEEIDETRNELIAKINALQDAITRLDEEYPEITAKIEELLAELERRDLPPEPPRLRVRPSGSGFNRFPYFVEAANNAIRIHQSLSEDPITIPLSTLNQNEDFKNLLEIVASRPVNSLIFLVRGNMDSAKAYSEAVNVVQAFNAENNARITPGRLPLPAKGKVDLSPFQQYLRP